MIWVTFDYESVMLKSFTVVFELSKNLAETEVSRHTKRIEFDAVSEILLSFQEVSSVCKLSRQVDARPKVLLVKQQALLEMEHTQLELLDLLILTAQVEVS